MADIFLSYSRNDQAVARRFAESLEREGFTVWWDQTLTAGQAFDEVTERALNGARAVVVLWSPRSVGSRWVRAEAAQADENGTLVPVLLEPCKLPIKFKLTQAADLSGWKGDRDDGRWKALVAGLRQLVQMPAATSMPAVSVRQHGRGSRSAAWVAGTLATVAVAGLIILFWLNGSRPTAAPTASDAPGVGLAQPAAPAVAVLPFVDLSPGGDQASFADGMSEEILNSLARISGLRVTGRTSSFHFKGRTESLQAIGQQLGVSYLLEGSVRKQGNEIRVNAQLVNAADSFNLWSQSYDQGTEDLFAIQEDIAQSVAEALQVALGVGELGRQRGMTRDVLAYEEYVEGLGEMRKLTLDGYQQAAAKFEAALRRDATFLRAWQAAFHAYLDASLNAGRDETHRSSLRSRADLIRAEISRRFPDDPDAQAFLRATAELQQGDWIRQALRDMESAGRPALPAGSDPIDELVRAGVARLRLDKSREAIIDLEQARARDPLNPAVLLALPEAYANVGRLEEALAENDHAWRSAPSEPVAVNGLVIAYSFGDPGQIRERWERVLSFQAGESVLTELHALQGDPAGQRLAVQRLAERQPEAPASHVALLAATFGDPELSLRVLREDRDLLRRPITVIALWRPVMRDLRRHPGFRQLVEDWGLVEYWKEYGWGDHCRPVAEDEFTCE